MNGVLYGRSKLGCLIRRIKTATQTIAKANNVPIEHISETVLMGVNAETNEMINPTKMVER